MEKVKTKDYTELLNELGIEKSPDDGYALIIFNDDVNDMLWVINALYVVCKLNEEESVKIMLEAHFTGKAVAKTGSLKEMTAMKKGLNEKHIQAEVEKND